MERSDVGYRGCRVRSPLVGGGVRASRTNRIWLPLVGSEGRAHESSDGESTETQFMLPAQYTQDEYRDAQVPLCAGPVDTVYTSTGPVQHRGAWCGYFLRLVEAMMRLMGHCREEEMSEQIQVLKKNPEPLAMMQSLVESQASLPTTRGFLHPMVMHSLAESNSIKSFILPPPAPPQ